MKPQDLFKSKRKKLRKCIFITNISLRIIYNGIHFCFRWFLVELYRTSLPLAFYISLWDSKSRRNKIILLSAAKKLPPHSLPPFHQTTVRSEAADLTVEKSQQQFFSRQKQNTLNGHCTYLKLVSQRCLWMQVGVYSMKVHSHVCKSRYSSTIPKFATISKNKLRYLLDKVIY